MSNSAGYAKVDTDEDAERAFQEAIGECGARLVYERLVYISLVRSHVENYRRGIKSDSWMNEKIIDEYSEFVSTVNNLKKTDRFGYFVQSGSSIGILSPINDHVVDFVNNYVFFRYESNQQVETS